VPSNGWLYDAERVGFYFTYNTRNIYSLYFFTTFFTNLKGELERSIKCIF